MDTDIAAFCSQSLRPLQHKARNPFPGCKSAADCFVVGTAATSEIKTSTFCQEEGGGGEEEIKTFYEDVTGGAQERWRGHRCHHLR